MNSYGPNRLVCLNAWSTRSSTLRGRGLVGGRVSLWGPALWSIYVKTTPRVAHSLVLLLVDQDVELFASPPALCLPACCHALHHDDNELNF